MSEDVPTFGRENLPREAEKAEWDRLVVWHNRLTNPYDWASQGSIQHDHRTRVPGCFRCDLSADEIP